jgi:D-serine deaminase-like pyridoxal phosphate-dependent protein
MGGAGARSCCPLHGEQARSTLTPLARHKLGAGLPVQPALDAEPAIVDILDPNLPVQVGDQVKVWAHYSDATFNLHRQMFGVRNGRDGRDISL